MAKHVRLPEAPPSLVALVEEQQRLDDEIATLQERLKLVEAERRQLNEVTIPEAAQQAAQLDADYLRETGEVGFRLADGGALTFTRHYYPGISKADEKAAHTWLHEQGHMGLFKTTVSVQFALKEHDLARRFVAMVNTFFPARVIELVLDPDARQDALVPKIRALLDEAFPKRELREETDIPGSTLKAFVKKCFERGVQLPPSIGVYAPWRAVVTRAEPELRDSVEALLAE